MLTVSTDLLAAVRESYTMRVEAEVWLGGVLLADSVPISSGTLEIDRSQSIPERLSFTAPLLDGITTWDPTSSVDPLSTYGQRISVRMGIQVGSKVEWVQLGWFLIIDTSTDNYTVSCTAVGLLHLIDEASFVAPFVPDNSFITTIRKLVEPALTVKFDPALVDRAIPKSMQWDTGRMSALQEVLDAWPAEAEVTADGYLYVHTSPDDSTRTNVSWTLTDDESVGTVINWNGGTSRDGAYNCVVAQGEDANGNPVQGVAYDNTPSSPTYFNGAFNPLPVPYTYYSPLLNTVAACRTAAQTILNRRKRNQGKTVSVLTVPNPALRPGDLLLIGGSKFAGQYATLETLSLPLRSDGGAMRMSINLR